MGVDRTKLLHTRPFKQLWGFIGCSVWFVVGPGGLGEGPGGPGKAHGIAGGPRAPGARANENKKIRFVLCPCKRLSYRGTPLGAVRTWASSWEAFQSCVAELEGATSSPSAFGCTCRARTETPTPVTTVFVRNRRLRPLNRIGIHPQIGPSGGRRDQFGF